jgi:hypothetical protein
VTIKSRDDLSAELDPLWDRMETNGDFADQAGVMTQRLPIFQQTWAMLAQLSDEVVVLAVKVTMPAGCDAPSKDSSAALRRDVRAGR